MTLILRAARYMRQAHNLKVVGSNPTPPTNHTNTFLIFSYVKKTFLAHFWRDQKGFCLWFPFIDCDKIFFFFYLLRQDLNTITLLHERPMETIETTDNILHS